MPPPSTRTSPAAVAPGFRAGLVIAAAVALVGGCTSEVPAPDETPQHALPPTGDIVLQGADAQPDLADPDVTELPDATDTTDAALPDGDVADAELLDGDLTDLPDGDSVDVPDTSDAPDVTDSADTLDAADSAELDVADTLDITDSTELDGIDADVVDPTWWDVAWGRRVVITLDNSGRGQLADFPLLVLLDETRIEYELVDDAGADLRFVDPSTGAALAYEIERYDETGTSAIWVRVPLLEAGDAGQQLHIYYDNPAAAPDERPDEVWAAGYESVHHLDGDHGDSTGNGHDGTPSGGPTSAPAIVAEGLELDGTDDYVELALEGPYDYTNAMTASAWVRADGFDVNWQAVLTKGDTAWRIHRQNTTQRLGFGNTPFDFSGNDNQSASSDVVFGEWVWIVVTYDGSNKRIYLDGAEDANDGYSLDFATNDLTVWIGANSESGSTRYWDGAIDEVRVGPDVRSPDWIAAQYDSMTDALITSWEAPTSP